MKCDVCTRRNTICVLERPIVYEAYCVIGKTASTHFFLSAIRMQDFLNEAPEDAMFRIFERDLYRNTITELT